MLSVVASNLWYGRGSSRFDFDTSVVVSLSVIAVAGSVSLVRLLLLRPRRLSDQEESTEEFQFTLRSLLFLSTSVAILLALGTFHSI